MSCETESCFFDYLKNHSVTVTFMVPSTVNALNKLSAIKGTFSSLKKVLVAGEALSEDVAREFIRIYKPEYFGQTYGSSETGFPTMKPIADGLNNLKSNGVPVHGQQVKISDFESNESLPPHKIGEIRVKGSQVTNGYINNPKANEASFDNEGFFKSGDAGHLDEFGNLYFAYRFKEIIKYDGYAVAPTELEFILMEHEAVKEAAVIGIHDEEGYGELPKAFVVLKEGFADIVSEKALIDYVSSQVCFYKQLRGGVVFVPKLKRTTIGKIDRRALKNLK
ncbi:hypothetical protein B4U79_07746 [Dinothrombium tinctorium]|uniref:Uncharacterized protein n=1 Tax=Dinothrombium tinctorium TaxID=1965070 RepID=A0A3S3P4B4_9ACAR|nr:hypothetical protein B4U79_07746 [Dinothrombium tinctorium]